MISHVEEALEPASAQDLRRPDFELLGRLIDEARRQRKQHHDSMESKHYKKTKLPLEYSEEDWIAEAPWSSA